jgi:hypothetical protein
MVRKPYMFYRQVVHAGNKVQAKQKTILDKRDSHQVSMTPPSGLALDLFA